MENSMCVEEAAESVLLVSCDRSSKQWKMSQVLPRHALLPSIVRIYLNFLYICLLVALPEGNLHATSPR